MNFVIENLVKRYNLKISGVIQIGAHWGEENEQYLKSDIKNIVYIEPFSKSFQILESKFKNQRNTIIINKAIDNFEGSVDLNIESKNSGQSNSILNPEKHL